MFTTRPEILGTHGVVATTHWLASAVGMAVLESGGNAFDAAVAAGFTLQVVEPHLNGPGGDLPIILHDAKARRTRVICAQGTAPGAATIAHYRGLGLDLVPGSGLLAACVPGAFDGWMTLLRDYGTKPLGEIMSFAIDYAGAGYPVIPRITQAVTGVKELFETEWPTSAAVYLPGGRIPQPGEIFRNATLAATWHRLVAEAEAGGGNREAVIERARDIYYKGWIAEAVGRFCRDNELMDASGRRNRGVLSAADMAGWRASYDDPVSLDYGRYTVLKCGAWSQGPVLLQQLALLKGFDIKAMAPTGPDFVHTLVEAAKLAYADREAWYGDPDHVDVPLQALLSDGYNDARRALIGDTASDAFTPGMVGNRSPSIEHALVLGGSGTTKAAGIGEPTMARAGIGEPTVSRLGAAAGDTVHVDVIDRHGNMVSTTPSGGWLQSSPIIPELGFCLGTRAQMFWLDEDTQAALAPGRRPRTTLSPSMALRDGEAWMAFGTPGGDQQDQWQLQMFLHHVDHGMNLQEAIDCPSFHSEHFPSSFWPRGRQPKKVVVEGRFPAGTVAELKRRGHDVEVGDDWSEGRLSAAEKDGPLLKAAANPRGMQGYAIGR
jgi:gamma-glutamyltranspeptidase / glutathione hydrolase